ncbi:MAG: HAMP domain-containing histidine kinase [Anaerolineaceae bacterium]|nr:HAMP domain-containing histidine kinase [Anaerolineaceae bacterium]
MSIRVRLSLFYTLIGFSFLVIFSIGIISLFTAILNQQVDVMLSSSADHFLMHLSNEEGKLMVDPMPEFKNLIEGELILYQVWDNSDQIIYQNFDKNDQQPLLPLMEVTEEPAFETTGLGGFRVLTHPIILEGERLGSLQLGYDLSAFSAIENRFIRQVIFFAAVSVIVTSITVLFLINQGIKRIVTITDKVEQINKSDDPSLRIKETGPIHDEIGHLTEAFNETMDRLEKMINSQRRFLMDVSHELRTPMTIIKGNVDIMRRFGELDDESLDTIDAQTDRLTRLANSLLLLEQVESGHVQVQKTTVNIADLLLEVYQELVVISEHKNQHMQVVEIDLAAVAGNRDQLKQVLLNLVSNAINYTPEGGEIFLSLRKEGNEVRIGVRDTGSGIPEEDIPHIFERFFRGEKSRGWHQTRGFGLGLPIAYWIVRNHNGRITLDSKPGEGTEFIVFLPLTG